MIFSMALVVSVWVERGGSGWTWAGLGWAGLRDHFLEGFQRRADFGRCGDIFADILGKWRVGNASGVGGALGFGVCVGVGGVGGG